MKTTPFRLILGTAAVASLLAATGTAGAGTDAATAPLVECGSATGGGHRTAAGQSVIGGRVAGISQKLVAQTVKVDDPKLPY